MVLQKKVASADPELLTKEFLTGLVETSGLLNFFRRKILQLDLVQYKAEKLVDKDIGMILTTSGILIVGAT